MEIRAAKVNSRHVGTHQTHELANSSVAVAQLGPLRELVRRRPPVDRVHECAPEKDARRVGSVEAMDVGGDGEDEDEEEDEEDAEAALADSDEIDVNRPLPSMDELERIASHLGPTIRQFGVQTRVWQVSPLI